MMIIPAHKGGEGGGVVICPLESSDHLGLATHKYSQSPLLSGPQGVRESCLLGRGSRHKSVGFCCHYCLTMKMVPVPNSSGQEWSTSLLSSAVDEAKLLVVSSSRQKAE